jgi:hypothetical protein
MYQLIDAFAARIASSPDTWLFYYAGHGIQTNGKNYLVPVDAAIATEADLVCAERNALPSVIPSRSAIDPRLYSGSRSRSPPRYLRNVFISETLPSR